MSYLSAKPTARPRYSIAVAPGERVAADAALGADRSVYKESPASDAGYGVERAVAVTIYAVDTGYGAEASLLSVGIRATDKGYGVEVSSVVYKELFRADSSRGYENRLSPVPLSRSDSSRASERVASKELAGHGDRASTGEFSAFLLFRSDASYGSDVVTSPFAVITLDRGRGREERFFELWDTTRGDAARASESIVFKRFSATPEQAVGTDRSAVNKIVTDMGTASELVAGRHIGLLDTGAGVELLASPGRPSDADAGYGAEAASVVYKELFLSDAGSGADRHTAFHRVLRDPGAGVERASLTITARDLGRARELVVHRYVELYERGSGVEVRRSPIPLILSIL